MENNQKTPLISLIVPFYNGEMYLKDCIKSIIEQDYQNIELILVDDGSSDNSKNIADRFAKNDKRISVYHQNNSGVSTARNVGIENSIGEYIGFIDADDYIDKNYVSYFVELIKKENAEIAITPSVRKFDEFNKDIKEDSNNDYVEVWNGVRATKELLYYNVVVSPFNKLFSKKLIEKNRLRFNIELAFGEDFNFAVDCFQRANKVVVGHRIVYNYRVDNKNSAMNKFKERLVDDNIKAQESIRHNLINPNPELLEACRYANWHTCCDCLNTIIGCDVKDKYNEKYKMLKKVCRKDAFSVFKAPISLKNKIKGIVYFLSPYLAAKIINKFMIRKFTISKS